MIQLRELIQHVTLTVHYGDSIAVECTLVVYSFLQCIVGLNECTQENPLWFRTPLKMAVPLNSALFEGIGGDFGYSPCFRDSHSVLSLAVRVRGPSNFVFCLISMLLALIWASKILITKIRQVVSVSGRGSAESNNAEQRRWLSSRN